MIKQYFQQAWAQLGQSPVISVVNVTGTALAIFLIMLVVMVQQVKVEPFQPEGRRDRFLHVSYSSITHENWENSSSNGCLSVRSGREMYKTLTAPEAVTLYTNATTSTPVSLPGQPATAVDMKETDDDFWRVFDFAFTDGKPYDRATFDAGQPVAVITESVARLLFGTAKAAGREFLLAHAPYRVCGVVRDVSTLATTAYAQIWIPYTSTDQVNNTWSDGMMGIMSCTILAKSRDDFPAIREECDRRMEAYNQAISETGYRFFSRNRPYDQEKDAIAFAANWEPDLTAERRSRLVVYLILLIVPAINLSSMTQSRLRQRVSEIGVRRAFGCTRGEVAGQVLAENFIVTLLAGVLGFLLSVLFAYAGNEVVFAQEFSSTLNPPAVSASILIHVSTFLWALLFCFVLNLLSAGIPAWRASRMNIVESIGGRLH